MLASNSAWDSYGSIAVGTLLGGVALFLIQKNRTALLGQTIDPKRLQAVVAILEGDPSVYSVHAVRAISVGDASRFSADVNFDAGTVGGSEKFVIVLKTRCRSDRKEIYRAIWTERVAEWHPGCERRARDGDSDVVLLCFLFNNPCC